MLDNQIKYEYVYDYLGDRSYVKEKTLIVAI